MERRHVLLSDTTSSCPPGNDRRRLFGRVFARDGKSDFDRMMESKQAASDSLASSGAKFQEKQYPIGRGWVVNLHGLTISDNLLRDVKRLGNVAELDMSKSTVTDDHIRLMHELGLHVVLAKLDLSHTAVTDAALDHLSGCIFLGGAQSHRYEGHAGSG